MKVWVLGFDMETLGVFLSKQDAINWVLRESPEAKFDLDDYWNGYFIEEWDVA